MSIELNKLAAEFNRYFTSSNGVDVPVKVSVSRDEWRQLFTAIQQAESAPVGEPRARVELMKTGGNAGLSTRIIELDIATRERLHPGDLLYTHPAPGVPDDVQRDAERYRWLLKQAWFQQAADRFDFTDGGMLARFEKCMDDFIDAAIGRRHARSQVTPNPTAKRAPKASA